MPKTISDFSGLLRGHLQDAAEKLSGADLTAAIQEAIGGRYSKDRPQTLLSDLLGDGAQFQWDLATLAGWQAGFSQVVQIEYPQGARSPHYLESEDWLIYESPSAKFLRFSFTLGGGKTARVKYTAPHPSDASTVPDADFYAVASLAASLAAKRLSALCAQTGDSSIAADTVDYRSKSQEYASLARRLEKDYENLLGTDPGRTAPAASRTADWQGKTAGGARLTH